MSDNSFVLHLPQGQRLSAVSGDGVFSRVLMAPNADGGNPNDAVLVATDRRVLAVVPVTVSGLGGEPLPQPLPAQLLPAGSLVTDDDGDDGDDGALVVKRGKFPNTRRALPPPEEVAGYTRLRLNLELLRDLAAAISPQ